MHNDYNMIPAMAFMPIANIPATFQALQDGIPRGYKTYH